MKKAERGITILVLGDRADYDTFKKFNREKRTFIKNGFGYAAVNYKRFLKGEFPKINTEKVIVFLFFPFSYWNEYIEHKGYKGLYGSHNFYRKFIRFWDIIEKKLKKYLKGKKIIFVNMPGACGRYRDKLTVIKKLKDNRISQPRLYRISTVKKIKNLLGKGQDLFLKPRFGSMGKGITFLSWPVWRTNFIFKDNKIINRRFDRGWRFREITENCAFLGQLLKKDIIIQEAVDPVLKGNNIDLRIYTFFNKVIYIYPRKNKAVKVITNITQGGKGDPGLLKFLPKRLLVKATRLAERTSKALGIGFMGIDIVPDRACKKGYVIDVNLFAGFPKRRTFNLARAMCMELVEMDSNGELSTY
jgi:glutathione synthase/RimK-type ligase-like ATP-grasp enzyme